MLVLSRKLGESIVIGEGPNAITVTVVRLRGDRIGLGIDAPKEVKIMRTEIIDKEAPTE